MGIEALAIPALTLQPLVENAVHHGAAREYGALDVQVRITREHEMLCLSVENDVDPASGEPAAFGTGLGTTRDRLELLYGDAATLTTSAEGGTFRVVLRIPARTIAPIDDPIENAHYARAHR
jgi:two-component system, LytTR family, sensor histidine kinase AlgZ